MESIPVALTEVSGLSSSEANSRLQQFGPNSIPDTSVHPIRSALGKFWAPVPWMLELVIVIELGLHEDVEASVIAVLLIFNAALSFFQESRAKATLNALKSRLALTASARRDGTWSNIPAANLVVGDIVKLSLGGVVPADVHVLEGSVLIDQSMLTGESVPIEAGPGLQSYAGALVRRGEAVAAVTGTGTRTKFGQTAELVRTASVTSTQQKIVFRIVRNIALFNSGVIALLVSYALVHAMPLRCKGVGQGRRPSHPSLGCGRSRDDGYLVCRQDRHADAKRIDRDGRQGHGRVRRGPSSWAGCPGQFGRRAGFGGCGDSLGCLGPERSRSAEAHPVCSV
jgi:magnesium-transporting ATPase (P-type)